MILRTKRFRIIHASQRHIDRIRQVGTLYVQAVPHLLQKVRVTFTDEAYEAGLPLADPEKNSVEFRKGLRPPLLFLLHYHSVDLPIIWNDWFEHMFILWSSSKSLQSV